MQTTNPSVTQPAPGPSMGHRHQLSRLTISPHSLAVNNSYTNNNVVNNQMADTQNLFTPMIQTSNGMRFPQHQQMPSQVQNFRPVLTPLTMPVNGSMSMQPQTAGPIQMRPNYFNGGPSAPPPATAQSNQFAPTHMGAFGTVVNIGAFPTQHVAPPQSVHPLLMESIQSNVPGTPNAASAASFPSHVLLGGPSSAHPHSSGPKSLFAQRSRRTPSIGGPPKALLGGPGGKKHGELNGAPLAAIAEKVKGKKVTVNLPIELATKDVADDINLLANTDDNDAEDDLEDEDKDNDSRRNRRRPSSLWCRNPIPSTSIADLPAPILPEITSAVPHPDENFNQPLPPMVDVFLPGKSAWKDMERQIIEEKLQKLSIEKGIFTSTGSGSASVIAQTRVVPEIIAPHARAASISSPADPALLFFKLNKLHQIQNATSPDPSNVSAASVSPLQRQQSVLPPRFQAHNRLAGSGVALGHGHSMSLAQMPLSQPAFFQPPRSNPVQIAAPPTISTSNLEDVAKEDANKARSTNQSQPDFLRNFGLDIPEEEEEENIDKNHGLSVEQFREAVRGATGDIDDPLFSSEPPTSENIIVAARGASPNIHKIEVSLENETSEKADVTMHTRQASRVSVTLSLGSAKAEEEESTLNLQDNELNIRNLTLQALTELDYNIYSQNLQDNELNIENLRVLKELDYKIYSQDAIGEWTGSEDESENDAESIGEWSNPSDEERARQRKLHRRMVRRLERDAEVPRRLPKFPVPPSAPFLSSLPADDMISNPSQENGQKLNETYANWRPINTLDVDSQIHEVPSPRSNRPLPPLPQSRNLSTDISPQDFNSLHTRHDSGRGSLSDSRRNSAIDVRKDSLNPLAKPFVFGARPITSSWLTNAPEAPLIDTNSVSSLHKSRAPSISSTLNAAALEFKPTGFTFRLPPGVPQFVIPSPLLTQDGSRPLPTPPTSVPREEQGREKRQRTSLSPENEPNSDAEDDDARQKALSSFKFPPNSSTLNSPTRVRRSAPNSPRQAASRRHSSLNASAKPFTFSGFSHLTPNVLPFSSKESPSSAAMLDDDHGASTTRAEFYEGSESYSSDSEIQLPLPPNNKQKRAPIPLDFKHPVSTNMVPAGLFKNLVNAETEERARSVGRSRLGSREIFEHKREPSLDDLAVPAISHKVSRARLPMETAEMQQADNYEEAENISPLANYSMRRRSSLPIPFSATDSVQSPGSIIPPSVGQFGLAQSQSYEELLGAILDEKLERLRRDLALQRQPVEGNFISVATEEAVKEAIAMFRAQLTSSATQAMDDSHIDARGEMDFELIKGVIDQGHEDSRRILQRDLDDILKKVTVSAVQDSYTAIQSLSSTVQDVKGTILGFSQEILHRIQSIEEASNSLSSSQEREALLYDILHGLAPHLAALRQEPPDIDSLTMRLSQAVKPHISQLIDLASDKRETAGLIVDRLVPILQSLISPMSSIDTESIISQLSVNLHRIVGPIDAHVIKEQVADLVVERLDSRLAVRDSTLNFDNILGQISENLTPVSTGLSDLASTVLDLKNRHDGLLSQNQQFMSDQIRELASELATKFDNVMGRLQDDYAQLNRTARDDDILAALGKIESSFSAFVSSSNTFGAAKDDLITLKESILTSINSIPDYINNATHDALESSRSDIVARLGSSKQDAEDLRKALLANTDLQVQLAKARAAHGQVRVEKDNLNERYAAVETERDRLRGQVEQLQSSLLTRAAEFAALESRNLEQERAMHTALERLKASDVTAQTQHERIAELDKANREFLVEKQQLKSKIDSLEMHIEFSVRDKDAVVHALELVQNERDHLLNQQEHWEELRRTAEKVDTLTKLIGQVDSEELQELKRMRDRSKILEGEHAALQNRFKDQETKIANIERASQTARQNLAQSQHRSSEWEKKAKDSEIDLARINEQLDQAEQNKSQLDADLSLARLQLEEKEAEYRISQEKEKKYRDDIASLETQVVKLKAELEHEKDASRSNGIETWRRESYMNASLSRPVSRTSTAYGAPTTPKLNGKVLVLSRAPSIAPTSPQQPSSTWDSIHAPNKYSGTVLMTPKSRRPPEYRVAAASPTPSVVSLAPTQGDDGWWS